MSSYQFSILKDKQQQSQKQIRHEIHESSAFIEALAESSSNHKIHRQSSLPATLSKNTTSQESLNKNSTNKSQIPHSYSNTTEFFSTNANSLNGKKSNLSEPGSKKFNKKKLSWADSYSKQLTEIFHFHLDDDERVIKKTAFNKGDISKIEKLNEREMRNCFINRGENNDTMSFTLIPIDLPDTVTIPEIKSEERLIQAVREQNTLAVLLFKKFSPDSASEPDASEFNKSHYSRFQVKDIPLEENSLSVLSNPIVLDTDLELLKSSINLVGQIPDDVPLSSEEATVKIKEMFEKIENYIKNKHLNQNSTSPPMITEPSTSKCSTSSLNESTNKSQSYNLVEMDIASPSISNTDISISKFKPTFKPISVEDPPAPILKEINSNEKIAIDLQKSTYINIDGISDKSDLDSKDSPKRIMSKRMRKRQNRKKRKELCKAFEAFISSSGQLNENQIYNSYNKVQNAAESSQIVKLTTSPIRLSNEANSSNSNNNHKSPNKNKNKKKKSKKQTNSVINANKMNN